MTVQLDARTVARFADHIRESPNRKQRISRTVIQPTAAPRSTKVERSSHTGCRAGVLHCQQVSGDKG